MNLKDLAAEFPRDAVHWRVQGKPYERSGAHYAMALAYIDARDAMDRLDDVCGPANWQDEYNVLASGLYVARIGIHTENGWVWKTDGAGKTAVEGDKGGFSDAFKRCAVKWGVGRYLYALDSPWVRCKLNNKGQWKEWDEDPWSKVKNVPYYQSAASQEEQVKTPLPDGLEPAKPPREVLLAIADIEGCQDQASLKDVWANLYKNYRMVADVPQVIAAKDKRKSELTKDAA